MVLPSFEPAAVHGRRTSRMTAMAELWLALAGDEGRAGDERATRWHRERLGATELPSGGDDTEAARIRAGDAGAFTDAYVRYVPGLCAYARAYVRDRASAEELVHDVLAAVWEGRERLRVQTSLAAYLYGAVRFAALKWARNAGVRERYLSAAASEDARRVADGPDVEGDDVVWARRREAVLRAMDELPDRCREAFLLRWRDELSYAEIAAVMGISVKTVEMQMTAAVKRLRARLAGSAAGE